MKETDAVKIEAAAQQLAEWLSDPRELGVRPAKIEYVEAFEDEDEIECMIFKYKKSLFSKWQLGIVSDSGVFSQMQEFHSGSARREAEECLEFLKNYWKNLAAKEAGLENAEYAKNRGAFTGFVLLSDKIWDQEKFKRDFREDWGLSPEYEDGGDNPKKTKGCDAVLFDIGSQRVALGFLDIPVPGGEAEHNAAFNYTWKEAVETVKTHQAQIMVGILGAHEDIRRDGELFVKVTATLCRQQNAIAVYANGVVYQPAFYFAMKEFIEKGMYPLMGLVWFGLVRSEGGFHVYTVGMNNFGKDDMEILNVAEHPDEAKDFLMNIAQYCIEEDVTLHDGETVGLSAEQRCKITRSQGVCTEGMTLKIAY